MDRRLLAPCAVASIALTAAACTGGTGGSAMLEALDRLPAPEEVAFSFADETGLLEVVDEPESPEYSHGVWNSVRWLGLHDNAELLRTVILAEDGDAFAPLDVEVTVSAGTPPAQVSALLGGQDADALREQALEDGWDDGEILTRQVPATEAANWGVGPAQLLLDGEDVILASSGADVTADGPRAADVEEIRALAECLEDVLAAVAHLETAIGLRPGSDDEPVTVMCVAAGDQADEVAAAIEQDVATGLSPALQGRSYSEFFTGVSTEVLDGGMVRAELTPAEGLLAAEPITLFHQQSLPGVAADREG